MSKDVLDVDTIHTAAVADDQHKLADEATQSVFGKLAGSTTAYKDRDAWEKGLRAIEDQYMEATQGGNPDAKTKGKMNLKDPTKNVRPRWKYRTYLPSAWSSSKSVCGQAMDHGIAIHENSKKTATEQAIKDAKDNDKVEKSTLEKLRIAFDTAKKVLDAAPASERQGTREAINTLYGVDTNNGYWS